MTPQFGCLRPTYPLVFAFVRSGELLYSYILTRSVTVTPRVRSVTEDMASQTTGRAPCAPRVLGLVLLFVMTRVRVKLNGSDAGVAVVIKDGWALPDFLNAAKLKLLSPDAAAAVDDNQVVLWLAGSDRVTDIEELEKDDVVFLALHGSPFKPVAPMSTSPPPLAPPLPPPATPLTNQPSPIIPAAIPNSSELGGSTPTAPLQAATAARPAQ